MSKLYLITNDKGRSIAYQKAIEALKRCTHPIRTYEVYFISTFFQFLSNVLLYLRKSKHYHMLNNRWLIKFGKLFVPMDL